MKVFENFSPMEFELSEKETENKEKALYKASLNKGKHNEF